IQAPAAGPPAEAAATTFEPPSPPPQLPGPTFTPPEPAVSVTSGAADITFRVEDTESILSKGPEDDPFADPVPKPEIPVDDAPAAVRSNPWASYANSTPRSAQDAALRLNLTPIDVPNAPRPPSTEVPAVPTEPPRSRRAAPPPRDFKSIAFAILVPYALAMTF